MVHYLCSTGSYSSLVLPVGARKFSMFLQLLTKTFLLTPIYFFFMNGRRRTLVLIVGEGAIPRNVIKETGDGLMYIQSRPVLAFDFVQLNQ